MFLALKGMGALHGEFVRAEAASMIADKSKPVAKSDIVKQSNTILRIMTTRKNMAKKLEWENIAFFLSMKALQVETYSDWT